VKPDKEAHDQLYGRSASGLRHVSNAADYVAAFEATRVAPYSVGGNTKGYVRGLAVRELIKAADATRRPRMELTVVDAGCGMGELTVYLACIGFNAIGVDLSAVGCRAGEELARRVGVADHCRFLAESLESTSLPANHVDFIIGHGALHHFIKYEGVPAEFLRIMKDGARGFFADSFGENVIFHLFHNKAAMERLGDVILSKKLITGYFKDFQVQITPADWFTMLDKLYGKVLPNRLAGVRKKLSRVHFALDRRIPASSRIALKLSGSAMTAIQKSSTHHTV
jgi:SAM-dependent methyltransferase